MKISTSMIIQLIIEKYGEDKLIDSLFKSFIVKDVSESEEEINTDECVSFKFKDIKTKNFFCKKFKTVEHMHLWHKKHWNDVVLHGRV